MLRTIGKVIKYRRLTQGYPKNKPNATFLLGKPEIDPIRCTKCGECVKRCPSKAIVQDPLTGEMGINLDECIYCVLCEDVCTFGAARMTHEYETAEKNRMALRKSPLIIEATKAGQLDEMKESQIDEMKESQLEEMKEGQLDSSEYALICNQVSDKIKKIFGRSLQIREVDSGSCNGCDYEINALNNPFNDIERLGIHFVASPRHADMLLVTGTASRNMELALIKTYQATPDPKLVVAVGACACSGGIFKDSYANRNGIDQILPVDVYIPGCPPRPQALIYGILKALEKME